MRSNLGRGLVAAGLVGVLTALSGAAQAGEVKANVPFAFTVTKRALPAGTYTISNNGAVLLVQGRGDGAVSISNSALGARDGAPKLVFHRYGELYVLREVWMGGGTGRLLPPSRAEREIQGGRTAARFERVEIPLL